jgi:anaerobic ribonucleoside-triphosphate reductase activating protein
METNLPQLNITIDTLTNMVVVEEHYPFPDNLHASLADLLGTPKEIACGAPAEILAPPNVPPEEIGAGPCVRIAGYWHNSLIEGPGRRSTVKLQGCTIHCVGCITPDSWAPNLGHLVAVDVLAEVLLDRSNECDGISIMGGEPFFQPEGLLTLVRTLRRRGCRHILAYSGYTYERLRGMAKHTPAIGMILDEIEILIDGPYIAVLAESAGPWTGSGNQRVIDLVGTRQAGQVVLLDADELFDG